MGKFKNFFSTFRPQVHIPLIIGGVVLMAGLALLFGFIVMLLWNWLMPEIFGLTTITYWQAWGIVVLSHILFKSGIGAGGNGHKKKSKNGIKSEIKEEIKAEIKKAVEKELKEEKYKETGESESSGNNTDEPLTNQNMGTE